jgi:hypothetical protein
LSEAEEPAAAFIIKQIFFRYTEPRAALTHLIGSIFNYLFTGASDE